MHNSLPLPDSLRQLRGLNLKTIAQLSATQVDDIVRYAARIKEAHHGRRRVRGDYLAGQSVCMLFEKPSTRTRLAVHAAIAEGGGHLVDISSATHLGTKESLADTVRTVSQFCSALVYRGASHQTFEDICAQATIPVINALTARYHPTQALADLLTIREHFGDVRKAHVVYVGDCDNNVARSLALAAVQSKMRLTLVAPAGYQMSVPAMQLCEAIATDHHCLPQQSDDVNQALRDADVIYTDVWYSMGDEAKKTERIAALRDYQITAARMACAPPTAIFMHCLPANRGDEVVDEVIDGTQSAVWQQAGNRRYIFGALFRAVVGV